MHSLRRFLSRRRLLAFLGVAALLFGLAMLHPYPRQSLFGPTIQGKPWCVWESKVRRAADPHLSDNLFVALAEKIGLMEPAFDGGDNLPYGSEFIPLYLSLIDDEDLSVRRVSFNKLQWCVKIDDGPKSWPPEHADEILLVLRQHLEDDDPYTHLTCATYLWRATKDREMIKVALACRDHVNPFIRNRARNALCYMAEADREATFGTVMECAADRTGGRDEHFLRLDAIRASRHFGKRGFSIIRDALKDPAPDVQYAALFAIERLAVDATDLRPDLLALQKTPEPGVRFRAAAVLNEIDAGRIPAPRKLPE